MAPENWRTVSLGEVLSPIERKEPVESSRNYPLLGVRWYGNGCHIHEEFSGENLKTKTLNRVETGDVVYNKMWTRKGAFSVVGPEHNGIYGTNEYPTFRPDLTSVDPQFLRQCMRLGDFIAQASDACRGTTSRARLNPTNFLDLKINLPPLPEQRKISSILSSVDDTLEKTQAVIKQLEAVRSSLFENLLTHGISKQHKDFRKTEPGIVPNGWAILSIGELVDKGHLLVHKDGNHGSDYPRSHEFGVEGVPFLAARNISDHGALEIEKAPRLGFKYARRLRFGFIQSGDVLLAHNATVGPVALVPEWTGELLIGTSLTCFRPNPKFIDGRFLAAQLTGAVFQDQLQLLMRQTTRNQVPITRQRQIRILLPPIEEQCIIGRGFMSITRRLASEVAGIEALRDIKLALLDALLSGQIRTSTKTQETA